MLQQPFLSAISALTLVLVGCSNADSQNGAASDTLAAVRTSAFNNYWYQGKAELTRYELVQARYGELRHGDAILIFVTEDFDADREVKLESEPTGKNILPIMKLNFTKKFNTGIYPYSMMTSVFTPVEISSHPHTLKVTTTSQEWCGHTFTQFNLRGAKYNLLSYSYFEKEGDEDRSLDGVLLEDEVWSRIRLAPTTLPTGSISIIPGTMTARLRHIPLAVVPATATLATAGVDSVAGALMRYTIAYTKDERTLSIDYQKEFPHQIIAWSETYRDGFGNNAKMLTTTARKTNQLLLDYWRHNSNADDSLRQQLGLP